MHYSEKSNFVMVDAKEQQARSTRKMSEETTKAPARQNQGAKEHPKD